MDDKMLNALDPTERSHAFSGPACRSGYGSRSVLVVALTKTDTYVSRMD